MRPPSLRFEPALADDLSMTNAPDLPEITQQHIDIVGRIAGRLAQFGVGRIAGTQELVSEGLVVLAELRHSYDPQLGDFTGYVASLMRFRLIDHLRQVYGRGPNWRHLDAVSLEEMAETDRHPTDDSPSVEDQVLSRLELDALRQALEGLDELSRYALLQPLLHERPLLLEALTKQQVAYRRRTVKDQLAPVLGRDPYTRSYRDKVSI